MDAFKDLSDEQKTAYKKQNEKIVKEVIFPAYTSLASSLTSLLGSGKNEKGLCYLKHGRDYYEYLSSTKIPAVRIRLRIYRL